MWIQRVRGGGVVRLAYSADGRSLYVLDTSGTLHAWDTQTHRATELSQFGGSWSVRGLHPLVDGRLLVRTAGYTLIDRNGFAEVLADPQWQTYEQICPDGRVYYLSPQERRRVLSWGVPGNESGTVFTIPPTIALMSSPRAFALSPDGRSMALMTENDRPLVLCEIGADNQLCNPEWLMGAGLGRWPSFSPDGRTLACSMPGYKPVTLFDVLTRTVRASTDECFFLNRAFNPTLPLFAAINSERVLTLYSLETGQPVRSLDFALGKLVTSIAFSPDGLTCAVGGSNKQFAVFDVDV